MVAGVIHRTTATVRNAKGLHMRPLSMIAQKAQTFGGEVFVSRGSTRADAKNLLHLMTLGAEAGMQLEVEASGFDGHSAVIQLAEVIETEFEFA
ncbi:MAG: HPr family phosphocarrier protein [Candidatus Saccharimonas sp.]|nr:HPr family phosphocarrier protein [Planctomycetaceae bacterium]